MDELKHTKDDDHVACDDIILVDEIERVVSDKWEFGRTHWSQKG